MKVEVEYSSHLSREMQTLYSGRTGERGARRRAGEKGSEMNAKSFALRVSQGGNHLLRQKGNADERPRQRQRGVAPGSKSHRLSQLKEQQAEHCRPASLHRS